MKHVLQNRKLLLVGTFCWTILIFIGCSLPGKDIPPISIFDHFDKVVHVVFFFVFVVLWLMLLNAYQKRMGRRTALLMVLISFAYGFALEFYQMNFVEGRAWDIWDGIADGIGGIAGSVCYFILDRKI